MEHGLQRLDTLPVSLRLLREVHAVLMKGALGGYATPGEFRSSQNWIGAPGCSLAGADFVPAPAAQLLNLLGDLEIYLQIGNRYPPLGRLAFVHQQFEAIHPFLDGSGRLGRLLVTFLMLNWGLLPLPLLYLSAYLEENRQDYYGLLRAVSEQDSWRDWVVFFLRGVALQCRDAIDRARRLQDLQLEWRKAIVAARGSAHQLHLADLLFEQLVISIPEARRRLDTTYLTARAAVTRLVSLGILRQANGPDYGKRFVCDPILAISGVVAEPENYR
jgi:Fic family protein